MEILPVDVDEKDLSAQICPQAAGTEKTDFKVQQRFTSSSVSSQLTFAAS